MDITAKAQNQVDLILKDTEFLRISVDGGGWKTDMFQPTFNFSVKNTSSCGCGSSFQFNEGA